MANQFTLNSQSYQGRYMRLDCTQQQDVAANASVIKWTLSVLGGSANYYTTGPTTVTIGGQVVYDVPKVYYNEYVFPAGKGSVSGSVVIPHQQDGAKTMECSITTMIYTGVSETRSGSWTLDTIPRAARLTDAPNFSDEDSPVIIYSNPAGEAVETLQACISLDGEKDDIPYTDVPKTGSSYAFRLTDAQRHTLWNATKDSNSREVYFGLKTVIGGREETEFLARTLTVVNAKPIVTAAVTDTNPVTTALTGDSDILVRYCSDAVVEAVCTPQKGATLQNYQLAHNGKTYGENPKTVFGVENGSFTISATDSRGNTTTLPVQKTLIPYIKLTCDLTPPKPDVSGDVAVNVSGNWFNGAFSATRDNTLKVQIRYKESGAQWSEDQWQDMDTVPVGSSYKAMCQLTIAGFDYRKAYVFQARAVDALAEVFTQECAARSLPVFDWGEQDFNVNGELMVNHIPVGEYVKNPTEYDGDIVIDQDFAAYDNCVFNGRVTINGKFVRMNNCTFYETVTVNGAHVQLKNIYIGGRNYGTEDHPSKYIQDHCLIVNSGATDIVVSDFTLCRTRQIGLYYQSFGGTFSNFSIYRCGKYGIRVLEGGVQIQNGKIYYCGREPDTGLGKIDAWCGGFLAYAADVTADSAPQQYIPEMCVQNVSIQQNFGIGMHLYKVQNSSINVTLMANYANHVYNNFKQANIDKGFVNSNNVHIKSRYDYRDYGMKLSGCKNVSGTVNGISCHNFWFGADKGYKDDIPSLNNIDVTWESTYTNPDTNYRYWRNPKTFCRFLPEVHAEIVNGLRIGDQFTEADCSSTAPLNYESIPMVSDTGEIVDDSATRRVLDIGAKVPAAKTAKKGMFRVYVEAPNLNIYPYIRILNSNWAAIYTETKDTKALNNVTARGQHGVYSGTFCYDVGNTDMSAAAYFRMHICFNKIDETLTGTVTPKIRVQYYPY